MPPELDESRRAELLAQFRRIADMAEPLMAYPLDQRPEIAGVYKSMKLYQMTIAGIQQSLSRGEFSARELARQTLDDIAQSNPLLNARTTVTGKRMLDEADAIDALRRTNQPLPALAGIPYAVKKICLMSQGKPPSPAPNCSAITRLPASIAGR